MKSRIVKISLWYEDDFTELSRDAKFLFLYLLTCPFIELTGIFRFPKRHVMLEAGFNDNELQSGLDELEKINKAFVYKGWIYIPKTDKHNKYSVGTKTKIGFYRELADIPKNILEYFNKRYPYDTPMILPEDRRHKTEDRSSKAENIIKDDLNEFL